jgi:hypothetical protein
MHDAGARKDVVCAVHSSTGCRRRSSPPRTKMMIAIRTMPSSRRT